MSSHTLPELDRVQAKVPHDDFDLVFRELGGMEHGLQQAIISSLFTAFTQYIRTLHLTPYHVRPRTAKQLRNLARLIVVSMPHTTGD